MRLCLVLGCTQGELNRRMNAAEFQEWWAWYCVEPWGEERADWRMGILASAVVNCWTSRQHRVQPADFLPRFTAAAPPASRARPRQTPQEILAVLRRGTREVGGRIRTGASYGP